MTTSKKIFLAPDAIVAFVDRAHPKHVAAGAYFRYFALQHFQLYVTPTVVTTAYMQIYRQMGKGLAKDLLKALSLSAVNTIYTEETDFRLGLKALSTNSSVDLTFPEAHVAAICHRRSIPTVCTFSYLHPLFGLQTFSLPV